MLKKNLLKALLSLIIIGMTNYLQAQNWNEVIKTSASDRAVNANYAYSVSVDGDYAIVGAYLEEKNAFGGALISEAGAAYILEKNTSGVWTEVQKIVASDRSVQSWYGYSVSMSGNYAVVGAYGSSALASFSGSAYVYERNSSGVWIEVQKLFASDYSYWDEFGTSVAIDGDRIVIGAEADDTDANNTNFINTAGSAYVFERDVSGVWNETQKLLPNDRGSNDYYGHSIAIENNYIVVGANQEDEDSSGLNTMSNSGSAYIYEYDGSTWIQVQKITASDRAAGDRFASAVSINGNHCLIGSYADDQNTGSAYMFERDSNGTWTEVQKIVASDLGSGNLFGHSVAIDGAKAIIGASQNSTDENGNNQFGFAGAAYIFNKDAGGTWIEEQKIVATDRGHNDVFGTSVCLSGNTIICGAHGDSDDYQGANPLSQAGSAYFFEVAIDPCTVDSDNDGTMDCNDGCPNDPNKIDPGICGCNEVDLDSDQDGLMDCEEINIYGSNPFDCDTDHDGLADGLEVNQSFTDPTLIDTDGDGCTDDLEFSLACPDSVCNDCPSDLDGSGVVDTADLLVFLGTFGQVCP